jgi:pyrroloquinoline quinone biosynthesis protein B
MFENMIYRFIISAFFFLMMNEFAAQSVMVLGIAQDAGHPQADCEKSCCKSSFEDYRKKHKVSSIAFSDGSSFYIVDATPDFIQQLQDAKQTFAGQTFGGILLTHAHIGHYTGLMYLGREAMNSNSIPVYVLPRMKTFIETNGPWNQLVTLKNIKLFELEENEEFNLSENCFIKPMIVPHREEFSETAGYSIGIHGKTVLFIPDIDKWRLWDQSINAMIRESDLAFLDATFFDEEELPGRNMNEVPHPFVIESMSLFEPLSANDKKKIHFIHFNHSNPLLNDFSAEYQLTLNSGFKISRENEVISLD